ncbi:MAG: DNA recombination protein RmuC [Bacteroidota bacterium]
MDLIYLGVGLLIGALAAWLIAKYRFAAEQGKLSEEEIKERYVLREVHHQLQMQADLHRDDLLDKEQELRRLGGLLSAREQEVQHLEQKVNTQKQELAELQQRLTTEFENIANRLLEEKSEKFVRQNQQQLHDILLPLREKIREFESGIEKRYIEEAKDKVSLKKEIEQLRDLNLQLSQDANNLVSALRGESKTQGDWGEFRLELLLEKAGLVKGIHYQTQANFKDNEGKDKRPDFIINLPDNKHLIIDSKVSLVAYERYFNAEDPKAEATHLKAHVDSIRSHIRDLNSKNYQQLYQINSPDYLLLFVPIEPAFALALQKDQQLFIDALDKNIVLVTTSTLLATMRTVSYIWKQEKQKTSVLEIARQSGLLYDKFVNFINDLKSVGQRLDSARSAYHDAMNKLVDSRKYGDTLVGRAERIRELGARTSKSLPKELLDQVEALEEPASEAGNEAASDE